MVIMAAVATAAAVIDEAVIEAELINCSLLFKPPTITNPHQVRFQ